MKVAVYKNLHKKCFSVKALEGEKKGRIVKYVDHITLGDVEFRVQEGGRQRVLDEGRKNVHAYVIGFEKDSMENQSDTQVTYNPYKYKTFMSKPIDSDADYEESIYNAQEVSLTDNGMFVYKGE